MLAYGNLNTRISVVTHNENWFHVLDWKQSIA